MRYFFYSLKNFSILSIFCLSIISNFAFADCSAQINAASDFKIIPFINPPIEGIVANHALDQTTDYLKKATETKSDVQIACLKMAAARLHGAQLFYEEDKLRQPHPVFGYMKTPLENFQTKINAIQSCLGQNLLPATDADYNLCPLK